MFMHRAKKIMRHFTHGTKNPWMRNEYKLDTHIRVIFSNDSKTADVKIVQAFTPFTNSVTLLVDIQRASRQLPKLLVLKLADRRFGNRDTASWSIVRERDFQTSLSGHFKRFGACPALENVLVDDPIWIQELYEWYESHKTHCVERQAYERLTEAQSLGLIPRFFGPVRITMSSGNIHPSLDHINGLLLEYIPGRSMASIRPGVDVSEDEAENISQQVLELGRRIRRYGVTHSDVHLGNIILRSPDNRPVLIDWGLAGFRVADAPLEERWNCGSSRQDFHSDIRKILNGTKTKDGVEDLWHRFRTPLSDDEQARLAENWGAGGWEVRNDAIAALPEHELRKFYYEDVSMAEDEGLRWKVRKGVRTRLVDDPVPSA